MPNPCITCHYARMRRDICGIYCTGGFAHDGKCEHYKNWREVKKNTPLTERRCHNVKSVSRLPVQKAPLSREM